MRSPCEVVASKLLPRIRGEMARELVGRGYSKKEVAEILGVTIAAVSQYTSGKRGVMKSEKLRKAVKRIIDDFEVGDIRKEDLNLKLCELCSLMRDIDVK